MSTYLNLAISFLSIGASLIASLLLSEPKSIYGFIVVVVIIVGSMIAGVILLLLWRRSSKDATNAIQRIRAQLKIGRTIDELSSLQSRDWSG